MKKGSKTRGNDSLFYRTILTKLGRGKTKTVRYRIKVAAIRSDF